jgi:hypothetical protein
VRDLSADIEKAKMQNVLTIVACDLLALTLVKTPGEMGAEWVLLSHRNLLDLFLRLARCAIIIASAAAVGSSNNEALEISNPVKSINNSIFPKKSRKI